MTKRSSPSLLNDNRFFHTVSHRVARYNSWKNKCSWKSKCSTHPANDEHSSSVCLCVCVHVCVHVLVCVCACVFACACVCVCGEQRAAFVIFMRVACGPSKAIATSSWPRGWIATKVRTTLVDMTCIVSSGGSVRGGVRSLFLWVCTPLMPLLV